MADVKVPAWLSRQVGPLPVGLWLVAGVGGLAASRFFLRGGLFGPGDSTSDDGDDLFDPITPRAITLPDGSGAIPVAAGFETNREWYEAALRVLIGVGKRPADADRALKRYLGSLQLTTAEDAMISLVLRRIGPPPEPPAVGPPPDNGRGSGGAGAGSGSGRSGTPNRPEPARPRSDTWVAWVNYDIAAAPSQPASSVAHGTYWLSSRGKVTALGAPFRGDWSTVLFPDPRKRFNAIRLVDGGYAIRDTSGKWQTFR